MRAMIVSGLVFLLSTFAFAQTGTIEGTVKLPPRPTLAQPGPAYAGQSSMVEKPPDSPPPAVVFIKGTLDGRAFEPPRQKPSMIQKNAWFSPEVMAVLTGTTVDFPNLDSQYHNVFSYSRSKRFDLGRYPAGESRSVTFDKPGLVKMYCEIHAHMRAYILVCENPFFAVTDTEGKFRIEKVPAGKHTLGAWYVRGRESEREVTVTAGQVTTVEFP